MGTAARFARITQTMLFLALSSVTNASARVDPRGRGSAVLPQDSYVACTFDRLPQDATRDWQPGFCGSYWSEKTANWETRGYFGQN